MEEYNGVRDKEEWKKIALREHEIGPTDEQRWAGLAQEERMLDWLHDCWFAAVAGDSPSFEAWPSNRGELNVIIARFMEGVLMEGGGRVLPP